jgi:mercuric reductase
VATVGLTEKQAEEKYGACSCRTVWFKDVPKARSVNDIKGLVKMVIIPDSGRIVGVHIISSLAADMIHEATLAVKLGLTIDDIIDTVHVFPTHSEAIKLVAQAFRRDILNMSCCVE